MDALRRALEASREVASAAVVVDAKDESAVSFYRRYGFIRCADEPRRLFLPMAAIEKLFRPLSAPYLILRARIPPRRALIFWIAKSPRKAVKTMTTSPEMNGGMITTELQK